MVQWRGSQPTKVQLSVYVAPRVKRGMKIAATMEGTNLSDLVEMLLIEYLRGKEGIGDLIEKEG